MMDELLPRDKTVAITALRQRVYQMVCYVLTTHSSYDVLPDTGGPGWSIGSQVLVPFAACS